MLIVGIFTLVGLFIIIGGIRSRSVVCEPVCAGCGYDVRGYAVLDRCSECGRDLRVSGAVRTNRFRASRRQLLIGLFIIAIPWLIIGPIVLWEFAEPRLRTNRSIIASIDSVTNDQPWLWDELTRRLATGRLSKAEASAAIDRLIPIMQQADAMGVRLSWSGKFYEAADRAGAISPSQYLAMGRAFYSKPPRVTFPSSIQADQPSSFNLIPEMFGDLPGEHCVYTVKEISMSGASALPQDILRRPGQGSMPPPNINLITKNWYNTSAPAVGAGRYTVKFVIQTSLLPGTNTTGSRQVTTGSLPGPPPLAQWTDTITRPVDVYRPFTAANPYRLIIRTDPLADPRQALSVISAHALCYTDATVVIIHLKVDHVPIRCWFDRFITINGQRFSAGTGLSSPEDPVYEDVISARMGPIAPDARTADLELNPDIETTRANWVDQTWGKPVSFKNIPLTRQVCNFSLSKWQAGQDARDAQRLRILLSPSTAPAH